MAAAAKNLVEVITPMPASSRKPQAEQALANARAFEIKTADDYVRAAEALAFVKGEWKREDADRERLKAPSLEACRAVDAYFKDALSFFSEAEKILKQKLKEHDEKQEALRKEEQRKLDEAARIEREKKEAEAREIERKAREKAEADRKAAEEARQAEEAKRREAEDAERRGDAAAAAEAERQARASAASAAKLDTRATQTEAKAQEKAAHVQASAASIVAPIAQRAAPVVAGLNKRKKWGFRIADKTKVPEEYKDVNETRVRRVVEALGDQAKIPGIEVFPDSVLESASR